MGLTDDGQIFLLCRFYIPWQFKFTRPNGFEVMYDLESLVDFFLKTGNFFEPETRIAFTEEDLHRIDQIVGGTCIVIKVLYWQGIVFVFLTICNLVRLQVKEAKLDKPSVVHAMKHPEVYKEAHFERDALMGEQKICNIALGFALWSFLDCIYWLLWLQVWSAVRVN